MASPEAIPITLPTANKEQRHCPDCGTIYECAPKWRPRKCPPCNFKGALVGRRRAAARRSGASITPAPLQDLERELAALRVTAQTLEALDPEPRARVLSWLTARFGGQDG